MTAAGPGGLTNPTWRDVLETLPDPPTCALSKRHWEYVPHREGVQIENDRDLVWWSGDPFCSQDGGASTQTFEAFLETGPTLRLANLPFELLHELIHVVRALVAGPHETAGSDDASSPARNR